MIQNTTRQPVAASPSRGPHTIQYMDGERVPGAGQGRPGRIFQWESYLPGIDGGGVPDIHGLEKKRGSPGRFRFRPSRLPFSCTGPNAHRSNCSGARKKEKKKSVTYLHGECYRRIFGRFRDTAPCFHAVAVNRARFTQCMRGFLLLFSCHVVCRAVCGETWLEWQQIELTRRDDKRYLDRTCGRVSGFHMLIHAKPPVQQGPCRGNETANEWRPKPGTCAGGRVIYLRLWRVQV